MWHFHKVTREGHRAARDLFRRACSADPDLSEAHAWLGRVSAGIIAYGWSDDVVADGREGTQAATRAVALDPRDPYAHYSFAIVSCYAGSANTGALAAQSAIDLNPSFALGHLVLGMARLFDGDAGRAVAPLRHGLMLNPNDPQNVTWYILLAYAELLSNMFDEALDSANRASALRPVFGPTFEVLCCCTMALRRRGDARRWSRRLNEVDSPERQLLEPIRANQPEYYKRIAELLQKATE
jgi:tetratricopeptide (TPR) repeat protein